MTIDSSYAQNFSLSFSAYSVTCRVPSQTATAAPQIAPAGDSVELPPGTAIPATSADERASGADTLLNVLDSNKDGSITKEEFTDGAMALLRRAGARHHHGHALPHDPQGDHELKGAGRLQSELEKVFDRVDANHDGTIDADELTTALSRARSAQLAQSPSAQPASTEPTADAPPVSSAQADVTRPVPADASTSAAASGSPTAFAVGVTTATFVAVAIQRYTVIGAIR